MTWFRVLVEGANIQMDVAAERRTMGVYVTRYVSAETPALASSMAISAVCTDPRLAGLILNHHDDPPMFSVDGIQEVSEEDVPNDDPNFVLFPDEAPVLSREMAPPPHLVIRQGVAFWVEDRPLSAWTATLQAFTEGCFREACLYDSKGDLWPIVRAELLSKPSVLTRLLPWRPLPVEIEIRAGEKTALTDILHRLAEILESDNPFSLNLKNNLNHKPSVVMERLRRITTPAELIHYVQSLD